MFATNGFMTVVLTHTSGEKSVQKDVEAIEICHSHGLNILVLHAVSGEVLTLDLANWEVNSIYPQLQGEVS
jgi:hypothetical protein